MSKASQSFPSIRRHVDFEASVPLIFLDLRKSQAVHQLFQLNTRQTADWWHLELPCGTCSRAHERLFPGGARLKGSGNLLGFRDLRKRETAQIKIVATNKVYESNVESCSLPRGPLSALRTLVQAGCGQFWRFW